MKKEETINTFNQGMIMDINPIVTPNDSLCNALNATLVTFNGNENALQCDMGNGRVETAYLPEGYVPIGTTELGGIIYIVSYNPLIDKCQIGSFPSPERSIFQTSNGGVKLIDCNQFYENEYVTGKNGVKYYFVKNYSQKIQLSDNYLNPGDKYQITINDENGNSIVSSKYDVLSAFNQSNYNTELSPKYLKLNVVSISDNGKMNNLNDTLIWYEDKSKKYYMRLGEIQEGDIDEYRDLIKSNYNTFQSKLKGNLGIVAQLECINSFDIAWDAEKDGNNWNIKFLTNWTYDNESSRNSINLYGIYYSDGKSQNIHIINDYPQLDKDGNIVSGNTDILNGERVFLDPNHNNDITKIRQNDGTDSQFKIVPGLVGDPKKDTILDINIMPVMPYGIIKWLERNIKINISKLGTGEISLIQYKYFIGDQNVQFNYGLEAYPELNKQVKGVTISFYEIDQNILAGLANWPIDGDRVIDNGWETSLANVPNLSDAKYVIENNGQASYSGYFSEKFSRDNLDLNYIYLTEISINYNNEKNIKYYRIFYNSDIFNDYYYNVNDFKEINLEKVVSDNIKYSFDITSDDTIIQTRWNEEPDKSTTSIVQAPRDYWIQSDIYKDITGFLKVNLNNVFNISILPKTTTFEWSWDIDTKAEQTFISDSSSVSTQLEPITKHIDSEASIINNTDGSISIQAEASTRIASNVKINYTNQYALNIGYKLNPPSYTYRWLVYKGNDTSQMYYLYNNIEDIENEGYVKDEYGDESRYEGSFRKYCPNIYNELSDLLEIYDVVALPTTCAFKHWSSDSGDKDTTLGYGTSSVLHTSINGTKKYKYSEWIAENPKYLMLYAMKTLDGDVHIFTFNTNENQGFLNTSNISNNIYKFDSISNVGAIGGYVKDVVDVINQDVSNDRANPIYAAPLNGYYVPQQYVGEEYLRYSFGYIVYYSDIICNCRESLVGNCTLKFKFNNNVSLNNTTVNNLSCQMDRQCHIDFTTRYAIDNTPYIDTLAQNISETYNIDPSNNLTKASIGSSNIYDYRCSIIKLIVNNWKAYKQDVPVELGRLQYSKVEKLPLICASNGRFRIKNTRSPLYHTLYGRNEGDKQHLYINNIPIIPEY